MTSKPSSCGAGAAGGLRGKRDAQSDAAVAQVQRLGAALIAVADDRHAAAADQRGIGIGIDEDLHPHP
jgi:hypothetical protein